ncbi:MAG: helix-turn-helix transcriptional regulator [Lachnospiraceae bacterium]|nr:helix-turn-helix transcriptional regulator [Lachnospiraceae bacterium]
MTYYPVINTEATGKRIKELCRHNKISVNDVKEFMGFENPQAIYKWQRGESLPSIDNFYALSKLLNVPIDSIIISEDDSGGSSSDFCFMYSPGRWRDELYTRDEDEIIKLRV